MLVVLMNSKICERKRRIARPVRDGDGKLPEWRAWWNTMRPKINLASDDE
jgi:hypothetical protein